MSPKVFEGNYICIRFSKRLQEHVSILANAWLNKSKSKSKFQVELLKTKKYGFARTFQHPSRISSSMPTPCYFPHQ